MRIKPIFAWYDFWVGAFYDRTKRRLYIFPVPMLGFYVDVAAVHQPPRKPIHNHECEGFDDPEERCPCDPKDCVCWRTP